MRPEDHVPKTTRKIGSINVLRFVAALFVVLYHFSFVYYYRDLSYANTPILRYLFQYGYLGVDLFFIISGFVISLSIENHGPYDFVKSRLGRLYPIFWISAIVTSLFLFFGGSIIHSGISVSKFFLNMTMIPTILFHMSDNNFLDGSYWTLAVEMKFYFIVLLFLIFKQIKKLEIVSIVTSVVFIFLVLFENISVDGTLMWVPNFIAGIIFYNIYRHGFTNWRIFALCNTFFVSTLFSLKRLPFLSDGYGIDFKPTTVIAYMLIYYILFILISSNKLKMPDNKIVNVLGLLTYPVYLLHQQIGRIVFTYSDNHHIPLYISFIGLTIFIFVVSFLIHHIFEKRGKIYIDTMLDKITPSYLKRL
jgi:peptidoglycan/LPS O-acetylase OafA/YrhL